MEGDSDNTGVHVVDGDSDNTGDHVVEGDYFL